MCPDELFFCVTLRDFSGLTSHNDIFPCVILRDFFRLVRRKRLLERQANPQRSDLGVEVAAVGQIEAQSAVRRRHVALPASVRPHAGQAFRDAKETPVLVQLVRATQPEVFRTNGHLERDAAKDGQSEAVKAGIDGIFGDGNHRRRVPQGGLDLGQKIRTGQPEQSAGLSRQPRTRTSTHAADVPVPPRVRQVRRTPPVNPGSYTAVDEGGRQRADWAPYEMCVRGEDGRRADVPTCGPRWLKHIPGLTTVAELRTIPRKVRRSMRRVRSRGRFSRSAINRR